MSALRATKKPAEKDKSFMDRLLGHFIQNPKSLAENEPNLIEGIFEYYNDAALNDPNAHQRLIHALLSIDFNEEE
jgi:hypothetical protein